MDPGEILAAAEDFVPILRGHCNQVISFVVPPVIDLAHISPAAERVVVMPAVELEPAGYVQRINIPRQKLLPQPPAEAAPLEIIVRGGGRASRNLARPLLALRCDQQQHCRERSDQDMTVKQSSFLQMTECHFKGCE